jgi:hypothetical protein
MRFAIPFTTIGIGVAAGLASALLMISQLGGTELAVLLSMLVGLPLVIVSLGWGTGAGIIAVLTAAAALAGFELLTAYDFVVFLAPPMVIGCHLLGLARPAAAPSASPSPLTTSLASPPLEWYPLGRVVAVVTAVLVPGAVLLAIGFGYGPSTFGAAEAHALAAAYAQAMHDSDSTASVDALTSEFEPTIAAIFGLAPMLVTSLWSMINLTNLYLGAVIVYRSGRLSRPWDDLAGMEPPLWATGVLLIGGIAWQFGGTIGAVGMATVGAFATIPILVGLGVVHTVTRGWRLRIAILIVVYVFGGLFSLPLLLLGLVEPVLQVRARWRRPPRLRLP